MNFAKAVTETFRELFTLRDPNNTFTNKVSRPKLKKMIGVYAGAVGAKPQKQIVEMTSTHDHHFEMAWPNRSREKKYRRKHQPMTTSF